VNDFRKGEVQNHKQTEIAWRVCGVAAKAGSAENGEPVDSSAFDLPELYHMDDQTEQAAFYTRFIQGSIKIVVPDCYEAILNSTVLKLR